MGVTLRPHQQDLPSKVWRRAEHTNPAKKLLAILGDNARDLRDPLVQSRGGTVI